LQDFFRVLGAKSRPLVVIFYFGSICNFSGGLMQHFFWVLCTLPCSKKKMRQQHMPTPCLLLSMITLDYHRSTNLWRLRRHMLQQCLRLFRFRTLPSTATRSMVHLLLLRRPSIGIQCLNRPLHLRNIRGLAVIHAALRRHVSSVVSMDILHHTIITLTLVTITKAGVKLP
jgi:hypothetical protein